MTPWTPCQVATELNGHEGVALSFDEARGRWVVLLACEKVRRGRGGNADGGRHRVCGLELS